MTDAANPDGRANVHGPFSVEQMLADEAKAIHGAQPPSAEFSIEGQEAEDERVRLNRDQHGKEDISTPEVGRREAFYRWLNGLESAALCCSGGGIRSAAFCLGVIQALARHEVNRPRPRPPTGGGGHRTILVAAALADTKAEIVLELEKGTPEGDKLEERAPPPEKPKKIDPENSLLGRFHYLSTVSGGGYVGSWLSSWRTRDKFETIVDNLTRRTQGADVEPPEISWLRAYSNYLTPHIGIGSADTWAAIAIVLRNLLLNWLVIIPVVCLVLLALKIIATFSVWVAHDGESSLLGEHLRHWPTDLSLPIGIASLIAAQAFTTRNRPPRRPPFAIQPPLAPNETKEKCILCRRVAARQDLCVYRPKGAGRTLIWRRDNVDDRCFVARDLLWAALSAIAVTIFFTSRDFSSLVGELSTILSGGWFGDHIVMPFSLTSKIGIPALAAIVGFLVYSIGWFFGRRFGKGWVRDYIFWALSGLIYGALVGLGAYLFTLLGPYAPSCACSAAGNRAALLTAIIFGVPWVLMAQLLADNIFGGFVSYEPLCDSDREWLGRAAGWLMAFAIAWVIVAFLVFAAGYYVQDLKPRLKGVVAALGGVTGIATALLGSSSKTPAQSSSDDQRSITALAYNTALAIAGPIFVAALILALSILLDKLLVDDSLVILLLAATPRIWFILGWLAFGTVIAGFIA